MILYVDWPSSSIIYFYLSLSLIPIHINLACIHQRAHNAYAFCVNFFELLYVCAKIVLL